MREEVPYRPGGDERHAGRHDDGDVPHASQPRARDRPTDPQRYDREQYERNGAELSQYSENDAGGGGRSELVTLGGEPGRQQHHAQQQRGRRLGIKQRRADDEQGIEGAKTDRDDGDGAPVHVPGERRHQEEACAGE
jgi:hypothetical protein